MTDGWLASAALAFVGMFGMMFPYDSKVTGLIGSIFFALLILPFFFRLLFLAVLA